MADPVEEEVVTEHAPITELVVEEEEAITEDEQEEDFLGMSDEDFEAAAEKAEAEPVEEEVVEEEETPVADPVVEGAVEETPAPVPAPTPAAEEVVTEPVKAEAPKAEPVVKPAEEAPKAEDAPATPAPKTGLVDPLGVDDAAAVTAYKEVFAPFKANGKTIQVRNADEARRLMQMGAGYTKSMMEMKPHIARAKTLDNNGIKTAEDLNYLIELKNGNPDAIKKLVRDAGIDPFDIVVDDASKAADAKYRPKDYSASETQVNFETTLAEVNSLPGGSELLQSVYKDWDETSQNQVYEDPTTLRVLTGHKERGIYDAVVAQVDRERMLGHLSGVTFLAAYTQVAQAMDSKGLFSNSAAPADPAIPEPTTTEPAPVVPPKVLARQVAAPKIPSNTERAKALAPVKAGNPAKAIPVNPMNMSDADFENIEGLAHIIG